MALTLFTDGTILFASQLNSIVNTINAITGGLLTIEGAGTHIGAGILPKGSYPMTSTKILIAPQANWAAGSANFVTRVRPQAQFFQSSSTVPTGTGYYPQFSVNGGSVGGYADVGGAGLAYFNNFTVDSDNVIANSGTGPQGLTLLGVNLGVGNSTGTAGGAHKGGRNAISGEIFINSDVDVGVGSLFHVGVAGGTTALRKMGGIVGANRGNVFGSNVWARARAGSGGGPRYLNSLIGLEVGLRQDLHATTLWRVGIQVVDENTSAANGEQQSIGLSLTNQPSATTIGHEQGITFSAYNGQYSVAPHGQMIATLPSPIGLSAFASADGINISRVTLSRAAFESKGLFIDGTGNVGGQIVGGLTAQVVSGIDAKVSSVASVAVVEGGSFDGGNPAPFPTWTLASPAASGGIAGTTATMVATNMGAVGFMGINAGGNGLYVAGETLTAVGGTGTPFTLYIESTTSGVPTNIRIATAGDYTVLPTNSVLFTGSAAGTGFALAMRWKVLAVAAGGSGGTVAGSNYNELRPPTSTYTGAMVQTKEARFKVVMAAGTRVQLLLNAGRLNVTGIPTSSAGLVAGDLWSNAGVLTVA